MIVSVVSMRPKSEGMSFTVDQPKGDGYGFRVGIRMGILEVGNLFDVPREALEQLESAIRAALIDSEEISLGTGEITSTVG